MKTRLVHGKYYVRIPNWPRLIFFRLMFHHVFCFGCSRLVVVFDTEKAPNVTLAFEALFSFIIGSRPKEFSKLVGARGIPARLEIQLDFERVCV